MNILREEAGSGETRTCTRGKEIWYGTLAGITNLLVRDDFILL